MGKEETIDFLARLLRHIKDPLLIVWDRLPAHLGGLIAVEYFPPYAPELNPVEYLRGY